jgi:hypothetical protein
MERSLALVRAGTRQLMVAYSNLPDALKAVHKAGAISGLKSLGLLPRTPKPVSIVKDAFKMLATSCLI